MIEMLAFFSVMTFLGTLGSLLGGTIGGLINPDKKAVFGIALNITAGIMTGIVCFDMIPEAIEMSSKAFVLACILVGTFLIFILDFSATNMSSKLKNSSKTASILIMTSMSLHNIIEGLVIGSSFAYSYSLGIGMLISIFLHDIPEGMVVGITNKLDKIKLKNIAINSAMVGAVFGLGALAGKLIGNISENYIALCLSLASGAMLYAVSCNLLPDTGKFLGNRFLWLFYIVGIILSLVILV